MNPEELTKTEIIVGLEGNVRDLEDDNEELACRNIELVELNAELLEALKYSYRFLDAFSIEQDTKYVADVIAKAEKLK